MKKYIYILISIVSIVGVLFGIYKIYDNNNNKSPIDKNPIISIPQKPTEPYGFDYLDDWQKGLYRLIEKDTLQIGDNYNLDETKNLEYVQTVIDLYHQNNPTRPIKKTYIAFENYKEIISPNDPSFKYNIDLGTTDKIIVSQWYKLNIDEELKRYQEIDKKANEIIDMIPKNANEYDKIKFIFDYLVKNVIPDHDMAAIIETGNINEFNIIEVEKALSIYGALIENKAVCNGFAQAFQYLANKVNIYSLYVVTNINENLIHAYNIVWLDGNYYRIDATWNDFLKSNPFEGNYIKGIKLPTASNDYIKN